MPSKIDLKELKKRIDMIDKGISDLSQYVSDQKTQKLLERVRELEVKRWKDNNFNLDDRIEENLFCFRFKQKEVKFRITSNYYSDIPIVLAGAFNTAEHFAHGFDKTEGPVLDGGANIGTYSILLAKINPKIVIHAFEPDPSVFDLLVKNVSENELEDEIICHNIAIGARDGRTEFNSYLLGSRVSSTNVSKVFGNRSWFNNKNIQTVKVRLNSIDLIHKKFFDREMIDIIKLDIEGSEKDVFRNNKLLPAKRCVVEYHTNEIRNVILKYIDAQECELVGEHVEREYGNKPSIGNLYFNIN